MHVDTDLLALQLKGTARELILRQIAKGGINAERKAIIKDIQIDHDEIDDFLLRLKQDELIKLSGIQYRLTCKGQYILGKIYIRISHEQFEAERLDLSRVFTIEIGKTQFADLVSVPSTSLIVIPKLSRSEKIRDEQIDELASLLTQVDEDRTWRRNEVTADIFYIYETIGGSSEPIGDLLKFEEEITIVSYYEFLYYLDQLSSYPLDTVSQQLVTSAS